MSNVLVPTDPPTDAAVTANRFTPDALAQMARLRAMADVFADDPKPLTPADIRIARLTSAEMLEKTAAFIEASPQLGTAVGNGEAMREAVAFELAYGGVRDEARALARNIDLAIMRRKLKAVRSARVLHQMARHYVKLDQGDPLRPYVAAVQQTLGRVRRKRLTAAPPADPAASAKQ